MAKVTRIEIVDDFDGSVIEPDNCETVKLSLDGVDYVIDLTKDNAKEFRSVLSKYIGKAERITRPARNARRATSSGRSPEELSQIRRWAVENGFEVAPRGRVRADVVAAFDQARR